MAVKNTNGCMRNQRCVYVFGHFHPDGMLILLERKREFGVVFNRIV